MKLDLTISIVTYNNEKIIYSCLNSIYSNISKKIKYEVIVVDNNSKDKTIEIIKNHFPGVKLILNKKNLGFGRGHNIAFRNSCGDFFLVLNPDIIIKKRSIEKLIIYLKKNKKVGIVSPKILNTDGSIQYLCKHYPTLFDLFIRWINLPFVKERLNYYIMYDSGYNKIMEVENATGAFMMIRREAFEKEKGFDENLFLYFEDTDLSRRISKHYKVIYYPDAEVIHLWNKAHYRNFKMFISYLKSMIYYFNKWGWKLF